MYYREKNRRKDYTWIYFLLQENKKAVWKLYKN